MDARRAFERFEKSGAGWLPVAGLSALAILTTLLLIELLANLPPSSQNSFPVGLVSIGRQLGTNVGYSVELKFKALDDSNVKQALADLPIELEQKQQFIDDRAALVKLSTENKLTYAGGLFRRDGAASQLLLDQQKRFAVIFSALSENAVRVTIESFLQDGRYITTANTPKQIPSLDWIDQKVLPSQGLLSELIPLLIEEHLARLGDSPSVEISVENFEKLIGSTNTKIGDWFITQSPLSVAEFQKVLIDNILQDVKLDEVAYLLIGFCDGQSAAYDRIAIEAAQGQLREQGKPIPEASELIALHAMTNQLHLSQLFPDSDIDLTELAKTEWMPALVRDGQTTSSQVEEYLNRLVPDNSLVELIQLEKPFPTRIFQRR